MRLPPGIEQHGKSWRIRLRVPLDVRDRFGRTFVVEKIAETDRDLAIALGNGRLAELQHEWNALRNKGRLDPGMRKRIATDFELDRRAYEDAQAAHHLDEASLLAVEKVLDRVDPVETLSAAGAEMRAVTGARDYDDRRRAGLLETLRSSRAIELVRQDTRDTIRCENLPRSTAIYREVAGALVEGWREAMSPAPKVSDTQETAAGETIMDAFERFAAANPRGITADSLNIYRQCVRTLADFMPVGFPVADLAKKHVREWQDALRRMPIKASESREFKGKRLREIITLNETIGKPVISKASINRYLSGASAFFDWLVSRDELDRNPVEGLRDHVDKTANSPLPYSPAELDRLFASPLFTGFEADGREHRPGAARADNWRFWLPLVALYTGARLSEIGQLLTDDIRREGKHWCIHVTDAGGHGKSLKTTSSRRIIPVHPELEAIGFLAFVERMRGRGEARLFPDIVVDSRGQFGGKPSKWFGRYFGRAGVKVDRQRNFHSFRHGMADALRAAGYLDHQVGILLGHVASGSAITRGYGVLQQGELRMRVEMIGSISFPQTAHLR